MTDGAKPLPEARHAVRGRAWAIAYERFAEAAEAAPLNAGDLDAYAESAWWLGRFSEALESYERAYRLHLADEDLRRAAMSALMLAITSRLVGASAESAGWMARAHRVLAEVPQGAEHGYLYYLDIAATMGRGDLPGAVEQARCMQELGRRCDDAALCALGVLYEGRALIKLGQVAEGMKLLDEAMLAATTDELQPLWTGAIYCSLLDACHELLDLRRAGDWSEAAGRWCEALPSATLYPGICRVHRAELMATRGDWSRAEAEAERAGKEMLTVDVFAAAGGLYEVGEIRRLRGDLAGAEDAYRAAREFGRDPQPGHALLRLAQGQTVAALASIRAALSCAQTDRLLRARLRSAQVEIALAAGDMETAAEAVDELEATAATYGSPGLAAAAHGARGALLVAAEQAGDALPVLRAACRLWHELCAPYQAARTRVLLAAAYTAVGDQDAAALEREAAAAVFARLGAAPDLRGIEELGRNPLPGGLTEREAQVLRLVAAGKSNRAVAAELYLSEKTVARHMTNIFVKLNIGSRAAATAFAFEHRLLG